MSADDDSTAEDVRLWVKDTIEVAGLGDAATENRVLRLADSGRGEEALRLLESLLVADPPGTTLLFCGLACPPRI